jgi:hypothetical protein
MVEFNSIYLTFNGIQFWYNNTWRLKTDNIKWVGILTKVRK